MTREEYQTAARYRIPVVANGIRYKRISAIIARYADALSLERGTRPAVYIELELMDENERSVTIVNPDVVFAFDEEMMYAVASAEHLQKETRMP